MIHTILNYIVFGFIGLFIALFSGFASSLYNPILVAIFGPVILLIFLAIAVASEGTAAALHGHKHFVLLGILLIIICPFIALLINPLLVGLLGCVSFVLVLRYRPFW
jgi:hypothetical protein